MTTKPNAAIRPACVGMCRGNTAVHGVTDEYYQLQPDTTKWPKNSRKQPMGPPTDQQVASFNRKMMEKHGWSADGVDAAMPPGSPMSTGSNVSMNSDASMTRRDLSARVRSLVARKRSAVLYRRWAGHGFDREILARHLVPRMAMLSI